MPEALAATEVGKEISEHAKHVRVHEERHRHERLIAIAEAALLSIVTLTAAWSGYSAAKWEGESSIKLAQASALRTQANRFSSSAITVRAQDSVNFGIWFNAYLSGNVLGQALAERRFRTGYDVAFRAWLATSPFSNPEAPKSPAYMPQYTVPGQAATTRLDAAADEHFAEGQKANKHGEDYIRVTVILASVLFIVGISSHFRAAVVRVGLTAVGAALLVLGAIAILQLPGPPG
jgi:hypothetical protein